MEPEKKSAKMKSLKIDFFSDGYSELDFNCFDIPYAGAFGYFNRDNYFYYLFNKTINLNWKRNDGKCFYTIDSLIKSLGLKVKLNIVDKDSLIDIIKSEIDMGNPLLLPVIYKYIFFSGTYMESDNNHLFLVNGYNPETEIIQIRESMNVISSDLINNNIGLYPFNIREDLLLEIWEQSNNSLDEKSKLLNTVYSIEKVSEPEISSYDDIFNKFLSEYNIGDSLFVNYISNYDYNYNDVEGFNYVKQLRKDCQSYVNILFDMIYRYISSINVEPDILDEFNTFRNKYIKYRSLIITKFHIHIIQRVDLEFDEIRNKTLEMDKEFFDLLRKVQMHIHNIRSSCNSENSMTNYAMAAGITADSCCFEELYSPNNVSKDNDELWRSSSADFTHWITFELDKPRTINKINITFDKNQKKIIRDFCIQGSDCGSVWIELDTIIGNDKVKTSHELQPSTYKYFRLYITHPGIYDSAARIRKLELLGESGQE